jgi:hypothetical protein
MNRVSSTWLCNRNKKFKLYNTLNLQIIQSPEYVTVKGKGTNSVADLGCLSRILDPNFSIPDSNFSIPDLESTSESSSILTQVNFF